VDWKNGKSQKITNLKINSTVNINFKNADSNTKLQNLATTLFEQVNPSEIGIYYRQKENDFDDFTIQLLLPQKQSEKSASLAVGDVNNDGLEDFFVGNAQNAKAALYLQQKGGTFKETHSNLFSSEQAFEDTDAKFIDIDGDNDLDLYVTSGGY
jgi:hypothetical protein